MPFEPFDAPTVGPSSPVGPQSNTYYSGRGFRGVSWGDAAEVGARIGSAAVAGASAWGKEAAVNTRAAFAFQPQGAYTGLQGGGKGGGKKSGKGGAGSTGREPKAVWDRPSTGSWMDYWGQGGASNSTGVGMGDWRTINQRKIGSGAAAPFAALDKGARRAGFQFVGGAHRDWDSWEGRADLPEVYGDEPQGPQAAPDIYEGKDPFAY